VDVFSPSGNSPGGTPKPNTFTIGGNLTNNSIGVGNWLVMHQEYY